MTGQEPPQIDTRSLDPIEDQIGKILHSSQFKGSELLRNLFAYLAKRALARPGESAKEYDVAVDVLGKPAGFDPRLDSSVRVHTSRLRAKLAEYYMSEGIDDPLIVEAPKGTYLISWHQRSGYPELRTPELRVLPTPPPLPPARSKRPIAAIAITAALICAGVSILQWARTDRVPAPIQTFWRPFIGASPDPIVAFSNHRFTGNSSQGLYAFREGIDSPSEVNDTYSGTGTVMAVHDLSSVLFRFGRSIRLKRAELLTWDEAQTTNLILIGSPQANSRLRQLLPLEHFGFKSSLVEPRLGSGGIVNLHPQAGEQDIYYGSGRPYSLDYAIVAMLPGIKPEHRLLVLAGTNTYGVQAAAEFTSRADLIGELLSSLGVRERDNIPDFEALMEVKISDGVPVHTRLLLVRRHNAPWVSH